MPKFRLGLLALGFAICCASRLSAAESLGFATLEECAAQTRQLVESHDVETLEINLLRFVRTGRGTKLEPEQNAQLVAELKQSVVGSRRGPPPTAEDVELLGVLRTGDSLARFVYLEHRAPGPLPWSVGFFARAGRWFVFEILVGDETRNHVPAVATTPIAQAGGPADRFTLPVVAVPPDALTEPAACQAAAAWWLRAASRQKVADSSRELVERYWILPQEPAAREKMVTTLDRYLLSVNPMRGRPVPDDVSFIGSVAEGTARVRLVYLLKFDGDVEMIACGFEQRGKVWKLMQFQVGEQASLHAALLSEVIPASRFERSP